MTRRVAVLSLAFLALGCEEERQPLATPGTRIERFAAEQGLSEPRFPEILVFDSRKDLRVFLVDWGDPRRGPAFGVIVGERIGWMVAPEEAGPAARVFDVRSDDADVFDDGVVADVRARDRRAYTALGLLLARDPDSSPEALLAIASTLDSEDREIAGALLDHPRVRTTRTIVEAVIRAGHGDTTWRDVRERAWALLVDLQPDADRLEFVASVLSSGSEEIGGRVTIRNPFSEPVWLDLVGGCDVSLLVLPEGGASAEPLWDQRRWWDAAFGGCRAMSELREIPPGGSVSLDTPMVSETAIRGDSIPQGTYGLAVRIRLVQPRDTTRIVPIGSHRLDGPHPSKAPPVITSAPTPGSATSPPWLRTGETEYELVPGPIGWETTITFRWTNPTPGDAFIEHCGLSYLYLFQKLVDVEWVDSWGPVVTACLDLPAFRVPAGGTFSHARHVFGAYPGSNVGPQFRQDDPEGTYRMVFFPLDSFDPNAHPFGDELPFETRVSNEFRLVIAR